MSRESKDNSVLNEHVQTNPERAHPTLAAMNSEMLDWLEEFVRKEHGLMLHDGNACRFNTPGLGIAWRTLRDAIRSAAGRQESGTESSASTGRARSK